MVRGIALTFIRSVPAAIGQAHPEKGLIWVKPLLIPPGSASPCTHNQYMAESAWSAGAGVVSNTTVCQND